MRKEKNLRHILNNIKNLKEFELAEIQYMVDKYPYHQNWRLLLAKKLTQLGNVSVRKPFVMAALYSLDHIKLANVLRNKDEDKVIHLIQKKNNLKKKKGTKLIKETSNNSNEVRSKTEEVLDQNKTISLPISTSIEVVSNKSEEHKSGEKQKRKNKNKQNKIKNKKIKLFYVDDLESYEKFENSIKKKTKKKINLKRENIIQKKNKKSEIKKQDEFEFIEWLASLSPISNIEQNKKENTLKNKKTTKRKQKEKFNKKKKKKKTPTAKTTNTNEILSETLAIILTKQGHQAKAIKMYRKLSLKYPKKSSYFAAQIEKINEFDN